MENNYAAASFILPAILTITMIALPVSLATDGSLSWFKTMCYSTFIYTAIVYLSVQV